MTSEAAVAIVTGAGRDIGSAIDRILAADGKRIVVNYLSSETAARELAKQLQSDVAKAVSFLPSTRSALITGRCRLLTVAIFLGEEVFVT
jgi:NAD(P)-dependent dehydrogenase (short-subunit alcohol dehydrogenase family)